MIMEMCNNKLKFYINQYLPNLISDSAHDTQVFIPPPPPIGLSFFFR
jgi:hypothetical protein